MGFDDSNIVVLLGFIVGLINLVVYFLLVDYGWLWCNRYLILLFFLIGNVLVIFGDMLSMIRIVKLFIKFVMVVGFVMVFMLFFIVVVYVGFSLNWDVVV